MKSRLARVVLFLLYNIAPFASFLLIVNKDTQPIGFTLFVALLILFLLRGKDHKGNPTWFGFRKDGKFYQSVFGRKRRPDGTEID